MKVLLVLSRSFKTGQTGDATQGRETVKALIAQGHVVENLYVQYCPLRIYDEDDRELPREVLNEKIDMVDVVHHLPATRPLCAFWRTLHHKPTLGSSIFWGGWERVYIAARTQPTLSRAVHQVLREIHNMCPFLMDYHGIDVFLPNSDAEGKCVMRCFGKDSRATYVPVPNGFVPPKFNVRSLTRSERVPFEDYIVVPGVFACRKNQIGLMKALRKSTYNIVFLGGVANEVYYEKCRKYANARMIFTGYLSSKDEEYWKILRHARVACLPSDCETPGIAMIEAAYAGARPVITKYGGTKEYYGDSGEYFNPCFSSSIRAAIARGWERGRLKDKEAETFNRFSWKLCAEKTIKAYEKAIRICG